MAAFRQPPESEPPRDQFIERLTLSLADGRFVKLLLAKHHGPQADLQRVMVRAVSLKGEPCLSFVYRHTTRDVTKNLSVDAGIRVVRELLGPVFRNAHLHTADETLELTISQRGVRTLPRLPISDPKVFASAPDTEMLYKYLHLFDGVWKDASPRSIWPRSNHMQSAPITAPINHAPRSIWPRS
jgi:hypothetical protein